MRKRFSVASEAARTSAPRSLPEVCRKEAQRHKESGENQGESPWVQLLSCASLWLSFLACKRIRVLRDFTDCPAAPTACHHSDARKNQQCRDTRTRVPPLAK